jgi:putative toxin-antitoxin system antitoxin component (TIGR02293 family)
MMAHAQTTESGPVSGTPWPAKPQRRKRGSEAADSPAAKLITMAFAADAGVAKPAASRLFERIAASSAVPVGRMRAELIPDSSWKRAGMTLGAQASQTTARLSYVLAMAERVWGNEADAIEWLTSPHAELRGASPFSMLKTEAGGRAVEALLAALEFGFPV